MCTRGKVSGSTHRQAGNELVFSGPQVPISKKGSLISASTQSYREEHDRYSPRPHGERIFLRHTDIKLGITKLLSELLL